MWSRAGASSPTPDTRWSRWSTPWMMRPTRPPSSPERCDEQRERRVRSEQMSIFLDESSKVIVQGMTGSEGMKHTHRMLASGTNIVGGVNPRKAGTTVDVDGTEVPVFGTVAEAMKATGADVTVVFVPPKFTKDAVVEAIEAEIGLAVVI